MEKQVTLPQATLARLVDFLTPLAGEVDYPETDGEPMAETDAHRDLMTDALIQPLKEHFRDKDNVYVSGNLLLYYEEGNLKAAVAPDVFVVFDIPKKQRRIYKLWEEEKAPEIVIELTSSSTHQKDLGEKRLLYEKLGVREYFLFDPLHEYLEPPLQGFRLEGGYYTPLRPTPLAGGEWQLVSEVLGLTLQTAASMLRLYDPERGKYLLTHTEQAEARRTAESRLAAAEAEIAHLQEALAKQQRSSS